MKKILILGGGFSKERAISLITAKSVLKALKKKRYKVIICEPDGKLLEKIKSFKPDVIFNALHGRFGEDGYIQAILESARVKYTHSGVLSSYIAMDKEVSKKFGLWAKKKFMGREFMGVIRSTFLVDERGKIFKVYPKVKAAGHSKEVLEAFAN